MSATSSYYRLHFTAKHALVARLSMLFGDYTYVARHGLNKGMIRRGGLGFLPAWLIRHTETAEEEFLKENLELSGKIVYDVGAFEGLLALFFAARAKAVYSFEANPVNLEKVKVNVSLNGLEDRVRVLHSAIGEQEGTLTLIYDHLMKAAGSADPEISAQIAQTSPSASRITVAVRPLDSFLSELEPPGFIKIDVEGMEINVLRGAVNILKNYHPPIYMEVHGATIPQKEHNIAEIVAFVNEHGYPNIRHVETGTMITAANSAIAREGHIYCS
jgi:FkbM family methyltransferase